MRLAGTETKSRTRGGREPGRQKLEGGNIRAFSKIETICFLIKKTLKRDTQNNRMFLVLRCIKKVRWKLTDLSVQLRGLVRDFWRVRTI